MAGHAPDKFQQANESRGYLLVQVRQPIKMPFDYLHLHVSNKD